MQSEVEVKFLQVDHDEIRAKLVKLGGVCEHPNRLMRRTMFDYPDHDLKRQHKRLRVRDEGDKVTVTYKARQQDTPYAAEIETIVESYDAMAQIFTAVGLEPKSYQESRRETWHFQDCEVVLDEWPWLDSYIEIEGPNEELIKSCAQKLEFDWSQAMYGSVDKAYMHQYPGMSEDDSVGYIDRVCFDEPLPQYLMERQAV
jgi:adenylate cyclase class 2